MSMDVLAVPVKASERRESGLKDIMLLGKLWPYMRLYKKSLLISLLLLPLISLAEMGQTFLIRFAIDGPIRSGNLPLLFGYAGGFLGLLFINYRVRYVQMAESQNTGQRIIRDLRTDLYRHYQTLSPRFYQKHPLGKLVTRLTADIENLSEMLSSGGLAILADLAMILGAMAGMFIMDWQLALVTVVTLTVLIFMMEFFRSRARNAYDDIRVKAARINAFLQENFAGMELVQLYRREQKNYQHFETLNRSNLQSGLDSIFYSTAFNAVVEFMTLITLVLILWLGGLQVNSGTLTIGALVGFFLFVRKMFEPVEDVSEKYSILQSGLASIDKVMALFQEQPDIQRQQLADASVVTTLPKASGDIVFENVSFGYQPDHPILKNLNLHIRPGEKIAIVGPSGAGKTTLIKLLLRFYDVNQGSLRLDGKDLRDWDLHALRRNVVSIQQDDFLFSRSVSENIALAAYTPDLAPALRKAAEQSNALKVIERLPKAFEETLEERGKNLSAGEKQLLLFARAVYHDPAILVLDEATSAIDPVTENLVQEAMDKLMADRTVLIVAHRLSTIKQVDRILVMEQGQIVQQGSHQALLSQPGLYQQFYEYQELVAHTTAPVA
ncbi:ABC transporter ATP-binding protein [Vampirovibrio sp.]|uniref:ABC transporter ATP-binding protein n=1 Tax=Vampirovibrio sp. TaxID=2717857 RepID=UPI0035945E83